MRRQQLIIIALVAIALFILFRKTRVTVSASASNGEQWTVYGTMGCGWTRKQLDYMKKNGKSHRFVDCDKEGCLRYGSLPNPCQSKWRTRLWVTVKSKYSITHKLTVSTYQ
jgi:hypothetical protein